MVNGYWELGIGNWELGIGNWEMVNGFFPLPKKKKKFFWKKCISTGPDTAGPVKVVGLLHELW
jgi:hypothetical protein